jgi:tetratricopeptide (TPR) repeat protein
VPQVFISYSHDSSVHVDRVLALSDRLRAEGVDCRIDQYEQSPAEGWPQWCERQVEESTFVLVACTETYLRRFKGKETPKIGLGVTWEGHIIIQDLYEAQGSNTKFIPILFTKEDEQFVPKPLRSTSRYQLSDNYDQLYRRLTNQPLISMRALGEVKPMAARESLPPLPSLERRQDFQTIWLVPYARNPFFTGREEILDLLRQTLEKRKSAALGGLGGVGKTQTAVEYAYQQRAHYTGVFWAKAESRDQLLGDFVSIARMLNLPSSEAKEQEATVAEVKYFLEAHTGWLLILDNADDLDLAREFLPQDPQGHLLLTTRAHALGGLAERLSIGEMPAEEGALLLLRRAGLVAKDASFASANEAERSVALQISQELGGLPLALDQAGAFIEETPSSLTEYLSLYRTEKDKLLAERGSLGDHPSVAVTFSLAFAKVEGNSAAAADLIRVCAFLAPDAIPEEVFTEGAAVLGDNLGDAARSSLGFAKVLREAGRFSLVDREAQSKTVDIHRLVQVVIQAGMTEEEPYDWAGRAVRAVEKAFPTAEFKNWGTCQRLLPHAQACASLVDKWDFEFPEAAILLNKAAVYLCERALFAEAEPLYQRALAIWEGALGPGHPDVALSLNNLAELYRNQGKYSEAEPLCQRALAIRERTLGPEHPAVATSLNNLALLYDNQGKYAEAEPLYQRALAILEKAWGPEHPAVATSLNNLALLYANQGKYADAEPLYRRALGIREKALSPEHPDVARSLNNLAAIYDNQGKYAEAEPRYQRALAILEKALGPDHPEVAGSLNNLALLYDNQGKYAEAEPLYQRALAILEKALGLEHPVVALSLNNLAKLYANQGKYAEAEPRYQRALAIREKALGPEHPDVALSLNNLAELYANQGKYAEAEPRYQRALAIREKVLGPEHPAVARSLNNLAALYDSQGKYAEAEPLYQRALAILEKALGPVHPEVAGSLNNLAVLYANQGKYAEAEPLYQRALAIREKTLGPEHPAVALSSNNLAVLYRIQGKYAQAEPRYQRALTIWEKALGPEHPDVARGLNNLASLYRSQGKYAEAEPLFQRALAIWEKALGPEHPDVATILENYAALLCKMGREMQARPLNARAKAIRQKHKS